MLFISAVQQCDSAIYIYTFFFIIFFIMVYPRILNIVPCAIQQELVYYSVFCGGFFSGNHHTGNKRLEKKCEMELSLGTSISRVNRVDHRMGLIGRASCRERV